ncbi:MAG: electron transfer flavoprotein subunit beta/FixA family protein [Coriobacteriales bacterium]|jgi:electron transfer flavoprotein beta subunit
MSKVVACFKWVLDEADITVRDDGSVDFSRARGKINEYDRQAIQAAVDAATEIDAVPVGLTLASGDLKSATKEALVRGLAECSAGKIPEGTNVDSRAIAKGLAEGLRTIDDVKLVICGAGSSDLFARQTAPRIASAMGWPVVTAVSGLKFESGRAICQRTLEDSIDEVAVTLPAVISVLPSINQPPLPGMKAVLAAKKKPVFEYECNEAVSDDGRSSKKIGQQGYVASRKNVMFDGEGANEAAAFLLDAMKKEGVL